MGEEKKGRNRREQPFSACNGSGKMQTTGDGHGSKKMTREIPCTGCSGTGKV